MKLESRNVVIINKKMMQELFLYCVCAQRLVKSIFKASLWKHFGGFVLSRNNLNTLLGLVIQEARERDPFLPTEKKELQPGAVFKF